MADAASKVQIFFQSAGGTAPTGWTENFWSSQGNLETIVQDTIKKYVPKRKELLGEGAYIQAVRATTVPANRLSYIEFLPKGKDSEGQFYTGTIAQNHYDPTQVDLLMRAQTADNHRRQLWIAGLPDSVTDQLLGQGVQSAFINSPLFKQAMQQIVAMPFGIRWKSGPGVFTISPIIQLFPIMVRNRKRGRPFFLFHGRRAV